MRKLTLDMAGLAVESFPTHRVDGAGTVAAHELRGTQYPCSEIDACPSAPSGCGTLLPSDGCAIRQP